jgi:hypothetical protein
METPDPPCRPGRSSSSQPRQRQGGNGLPEIGSSPEPISRRPSCRCGFVDQLAQRIGGSPPRPLRRQKRRSTRSPSLTQPMYAVTPGYSSTWCEPTQPSNAQPSCLSADSRPAGKPDSSWARRSANSTPACSREEQNLPGHRRLLFRDCGARVGRAAIDRFCSGPRQSRPRARWFVESLSMPLSC